MKKKTTANKRVKDALAKHGVKHWELASLMGIHETTLCRRLREELPEEEQNELIRLIAEGGH